MNVGGVKQAANIFVPVFFFTYEIGHDNENKTKFWKSRSKYAVSNDSHFKVHSEKLTFDVDGTYEFH